MSRHAADAGQYTPAVRTLLALILIALGLGLGLYGIAEALAPFVGLYESALTDPMNDAGAAEPAKGEVSRRMLRGVAIGAAGLVPLAIGTIMLKARMIRKLRKRGRGS